MRLEKSKNAGKNIILELIQNAYGIIIPFIQRTLMITYLGIEYAGLGGLFTSILSVLSLAELGVGSALVYSMYKPIAEDDENKVLKLLNLYKKYYRIIGIVIAAIGLIITPFLKYLIKGGTCPKDLNIYVLFLMTLASTVMTYWLYAYKSSIISAYQKNYIGTRVKLEVTIPFDILQVVFIVVFKNYYLYLGCALARVVVNNIAIAYKVNKVFPQYKKPEGKIEKAEEKKIQKNVKDIFLNRIGVVLTESFDAVVISTFLGLTILGRYQNYLYIWTSVTMVAGIVFNATRAGIGNSLIKESRTKVYGDLKTFTLIVFWMISIMVAGFSNLYQPFMKIWVGEKNVLQYGVVICLCLYAFVRMINYLFSTYKDAAGIWHSDRYRPLISGIVNLIFNLVTVQFWGLYGVILSTVVTKFLIEVPWLIYNIFHTIFKEMNVKKYLLYCLNMTICLLVTVCVTYLACYYIKLDGMLEIVVKLVVAMITCNLVMCLLMFKTKEFNSAKNIVIKIIKK